jgi:hypothetical protein
MEVRSGVGGPEGKSGTVVAIVCSLYLKGKIAAADVSAGR